MKTARNPNGEPYPAFTSDKSWDEASGETVAHRQVPLIQRVEKMVEVPQVQFIDKVVDIPVIKQKQMSVGASGSCAESQEEDEQEERKMGGSLVQGGEHRREEDETDTQVPGSKLVQVAPNMGAGGSHLQATKDQERDKELREIRRMIEFLVNRERKFDAKTDVAARRLERLERESSQLEDEEREASLGEFFRRVPSFKPKSQEEFEEEFRRRVMTGYSSGSTEGREKYLDEWKIELQKKVLGRRQSIGSQRTGEDGRRRFQLQETHGVGENLRPIPVPESGVLSGDVGRDVVSSVETTFSNHPGNFSKTSRGSVQ